MLEVKVQGAREPASWNKTVCKMDRKMTQIDWLSRDQHIFQLNSGYDENILP